MKFPTTILLVAALNWGGAMGNNPYSTNDITDCDIENYEAVSSYVYKHGKNPRYVIVSQYKKLIYELKFNRFDTADDNAVTSNPILSKQLRMPPFAALSDEEAMLYLMKLLVLLHKYVCPNGIHLDNALAQTLATEGSILWDFANSNEAIRTLPRPWKPRLPSLYAVMGRDALNADLTTLVNGDLSSESVRSFANSAEFDVNFYIIRANAMIKEKVLNLQPLNFITKNEWLKHHLIDLPSLDRYSYYAAAEYLSLTLVVLRQISAPTNRLLTIPDLIASSVLDLIAENILLSRVRTVEDDRNLGKFQHFNNRDNSVVRIPLVKALEFANKLTGNTDAQYLLEVAFDNFLAYRHSWMDLRYSNGPLRKFGELIKTAIKLVKTSRSIAPLIPTIEANRGHLTLGFGRSTP